MFNFYAKNHTCALAFSLGIAGASGHPLTMKRPNPRDIITGIAIAGLMLPEGVAYAGIAGLPAGRALAAAIAGALAYGLVGRSRFAVVSSTSSSAAILAAAIAGLTSRGGGGLGLRRKAAATGERHRRRADPHPHRPIFPHALPPCA